MDAAETMYKALAAVIAAARANKACISEVLEGTIKDAMMAYRPATTLRADGKLPAFVGTCPACGEAVTADQDAVWTCPRDLSPSNRYWEPSEVTEAQRVKAGIYSNCYEDFGGHCGDHMPLHGKCYEAGNH